MTRNEREDLLWDLADSHPDRPSSPPSEETMEAFRRNRLPTRERTRVEWLLCRCSKTRRRLLELSGHKPAAPPDWIEQSLLRGQPRKRGGLRRLRRARFAAVAAMVAMIGFAAWLWIQMPGEAPPLDRLAYEIRVEGISNVRSNAASHTAHPRTRLRLWVEPLEAAPGAVQFGLYRLEATGLRLLQPEELLDSHISRGAARFEVRAETLVGESPGTRRAFVVVSHRASPLPDEVPLTGTTPVAELEAATGGVAYSTTIEIVPEPEMLHE